MDSSHVLLVEDDEVFAQVVGKSLSRRGYRVTHAVDAEQASALIETEAFDLAILDLNLGKKSSLELVKPLKHKYPQIRILILTGFASITTAVEAIKLGVDNYLAKPTDADEILAALLAEPKTRQTENSAQHVLEPMSVRRLKWEHIQKVLHEHNGNVSETARQLKTHRRTLQRKLQKKPVSK